MTRSGRASGSGEGADAAVDRGAHDPEARAGPGGAQDSAAWAGPGGLQDAEARARQTCLRLLVAAPRTRAQLAEAMQHRGIPADAAEAILIRFTDAGLIDDAAFARAWVESRHHSRGLSKRSLSAELRRHGVQGEE